MIRRFLAVGHTTVALLMVVTNEDQPNSRRIALQILMLPSCVLTENQFSPTYVFLIPFVQTLVHPSQRTHDKCKEILP